MTAIKGFVHRHRLSVMYVPVLLLFAVFVFAPLISGLNIALTNWNGYSQHYQYVGFDNFRQLATDERIHRSFINTMFYGVGSTIIQNIWGLLYALLLNQLFFGRSAVRAFVYLPVIMSGLVMGYIWYFILQYSGGALNDLMLLLGMERVDWLANGTRNVGIITYVTSMQFVGQAMIIYLAGLQLIQKSYYEAAAIDGANAWRKFAHITLPLLLPAMLTTVILKLIGGLQLFDKVIALTGGGPGYSSHSFSTMINFLYLINQNAGLAAALGLALFTLTFIVVAAAYKLLTRKEVDH